MATEEQIAKQLGELATSGRKAAYEARKADYLKEDWIDEAVMTAVHGLNPVSPRATSKQAAEMLLSTGPQLMAAGLVSVYATPPAINRLADEIDHQIKMGHISLNPPPTAADIQQAWQAIVYDRANPAATRPNPMSPLQHALFEIISKWASTNAPPGTRIQVPADITVPAGAWTWEHLISQSITDAIANNTKSFQKKIAESCSFAGSAFETKLTGLEAKVAATTTTAQLNAAGIPAANHALWQLRLQAEATKMKDAVQKLYEDTFDYQAFPDPQSGRGRREPSLTIVNQAAGLLSDRGEHAVELLMNANAVNLVIPPSPANTVELHKAVATSIAEAKMQGANNRQQEITAGAVGDQLITAQQALAGTILEPEVAAAIGELGGKATQAALKEIKAAEDKGVVMTQYDRDVILQAAVKGAVNLALTESVNAIDPADRTVAIKKAMSLEVENECMQEARDIAARMSNAALPSAALVAPLPAYPQLINPEADQIRAETNRILNLPAGIPYPPAANVAAMKANMAMDAAEIDQIIKEGDAELRKKAGLSNQAYRDNLKRKMAERPVQHTNSRLKIGNPDVFFVPGDEVITANGDKLFVHKKHGKIAVSFDLTARDEAGRIIQAQDAILTLFKAKADDKEKNPTTHDATNDDKIVLNEKFTPRDIEEITKAMAALNHSNDLSKRIELTPEAEVRLQKIMDRPWYLGSVPKGEHQTYADLKTAIDEHNANIDRRNDNFKPK